MKVPRDKLDAAVEAVMVLARYATNSSGLRIMFRPDPSQVERHILAMLAVLSPAQGLPDTCMPEDVHEVDLRDLPKAPPV